MYIDGFLIKTSDEQVFKSIINRFYTIFVLFSSYITRKMRNFASKLNKSALIGIKRNRQG